MLGRGVSGEGERGETRKTRRIFNSQLPKDE